MQQGFAIDGTFGFLLLVLPIVLVALAAIWAARQSRTPPSAAATPPQRETAEGTMDMQRASAPAPLAPAEPPPVVDVPVTITRGSVAAPPAKPALPADAVLKSPEEFAASVARSEAGGDKAELAHLHIDQATAYIAAGRKDEAASCLRDAIRVAALNRLAAPHARALLELGDLYFSNGDPTTACEQWQIARNLFHDLARPADRDSVDKRMLSNGCPTDWVLTDF
jgi:tetratricopeptide (TPR) repeat protein